MSKLRLISPAVVCVALLGCPEKKTQVPPEVAAAKPPPPAEPSPSNEPGAETGADAPAPSQGGVGSIEGEVVLTGPAPVMQPLKRGADPVCGKTELNDESVVVKDGKLANAVVRLTKNAPKGPAKTGQVVIDQHDCMYRPRVQAAQKGQSLAIRNSDGTLHNVHAYHEGTKTWFNQAQPPKAAELVKPLDKDGVVKFKCDVHPWMTGFIVTTDNPYFATTEGAGSFALKDVPAGTYTLESWHERYGTKSQTVTVKGGETAKVTFSYGADDRG